VGANILFLIWVVPNISLLKDFTMMFQLPNGPTLYVFITAAFSLAIQYYLGASLYFSAWIAFKSGSSNMDTLVVIGTTSSIIYGIIIFFMGYGLALQNKPAYQMKITEHAHSFEVSSTILFIICIGKYLEAYAKSRTVQKLSDLASIKVTKACLFTPADKRRIDFNGEERIIEVDLLNKNDYIKVINGQIIPTDSTVIYGQGHCNESMLTGESVLAKKEELSKVFGGTLLEKGSLILRVDVIEEDSSLNQILTLVENAQTNRAPIQAYADKISSYFVPVIILCAICSWIIWFTVVYTDNVSLKNVSESKFNFAFTFGISTVVIACPCALGLATPTAVMVCSGMAANLGILIKGGSILEKASKVNTVVFDKTGTLTQGIPEVSDSIHYNDDLNRSETEYIAAICESESEHPIGKSISASLMANISAETKTEFSKKYTLIDFENFNGEGILCRARKAESNEDQDKVQDNDTTKMLICIGNEKIMARFMIKVNPQVLEDVKRLEEDGKTVIQVAVNGSITLVIALQEQHLSKVEASTVCKYLKTNGFEVHMITGDHKHSAFKIADALDIDRDNVTYRAYPEDKKLKVQQLQREGKIVMFVGDGVNDSPVLAQSDVGVAINTQSDITVEAADVVVIKDNLISIIDTIRLTKLSFKRIKINFFWAFIYNIILIPIAMGILYPIIGFRLSPHLAALAMALSSISVVASSLMLKFYKGYRN